MCVCVREREGESRGEKEKEGGEEGKFAYLPSCTLTRSCFYVPITICSVTKKKNFVYIALAS